MDKNEFEKAMHAFEESTWDGKDSLKIIIAYLQGEIETLQGKVENLEKQISDLGNSNTQSTDTLSDLIEDLDIDANAKASFKMLVALGMDKTDILEMVKIGMTNGQQNN